MAIAENQTESFAKDVNADFYEELETADALLLSIVADGGKPTYAHYTYFAQHLGWDQTTVKEKLRRASQVASLLPIAGNPSDRAAAAKEAAAAAEVFAKEGPKLQAKITELQSKLDAFDRDARLSAKRCEEQNLAVSRLREFAPEHIRRYVNDQRQFLNGTIRRQIADIEGRINELECVFSPSKYPTEQDHLQTVRRCRRDAVQTVVNNKASHLILSSAWPSIRVELETELASLREQLEPLQSQYDHELAKIETELNYYAG